MSSIPKLLESLKKMRESKDISPAVLLQELKEIKAMLVAHLLNNELKELSNIVKEKIPENKPELSPKDAIKSLEEIVTIRKNGEIKEFLLHRATEDFEYDKSGKEVGQFKTDKDTLWFAEYTSTENKQQGANPVVSCWIPESQIAGVPNPHDNTGTWGNLGENPFSDRYIIIVKPGKYEIYQQLKKSVEIKPSLISLLNKLKNRHPDELFEDEDPWTQAKYRRNGEAEHKEFKDNYVDEEEDEEPLQKAAPKLKEVKPKQPKIKAVSENRKIAESVASQANEEMEHAKIDPKTTDLIMNKDPKPVHLYRAYKNTPHRPESLFLKYAVHRIENLDKYAKAAPDQRLDMTREFLALHQKGKAAEKNGHIQSKHLINELSQNANVMEHLMNHRDALHKIVMSPLFKDTHVHMINGEPHVGLTRGLNVEKEDRGPDHALASYGHKTETGFGKYMHHQLVPLKNIWYSFDFGPKAASSAKWGAESEWLVSPHENKYADKSVVKSFPKELHLKSKKDYEDIYGGIDSVVKSKNLDVGDLINHIDVNKLNPQQIDNFINSESYGAKKAVAKYKNLTPEQIDKLVTDEYAVNTHLADHPNLQPHHIDKLMHHGMNLVKLASRDDLLPHHVDKILERGDSFALHHLASKTNLLPHQYEAIFNKDSSFIKSELAQNPGVSNSILEKLANDGSIEVRKMASDQLALRAKKGARK